MATASAKNIILFRQVNQQWQAFACSTSCEVTLSAEMSDVSTGQWTEVKPKSLSFGMRGSFLVPSANREELATLMISGTPLLCRLASVTAHPDAVSPSGYTQDSQLMMQGYCIITDLSFSAGNGQSAAVSLTLKGTGAMTYKENALKVSILIDGVKVKPSSAVSVEFPALTWTIAFKNPLTGAETPLAVTDLDSFQLSDGLHILPVTQAVSGMTWPYSITKANHAITAKAVYMTSYCQEDSCAVRFDYPAHFGIVDSDFVVSAASVAALTAVTVQGESHTQNNISMRNKRIVFAWADRQINRITDGGGQVQTNGFTMSSVVINGRDYFVACQTLPSSVSDYSLNFE